MSATLDLQPLAKLLGDAPIVTARGRSFEVETHYVARRTDIPIELQMASTVRAALSAHDGDVLCFLPGAAEISRVQRNLETAGLGPAVRVLPLYGELAGAAQDAALAPAPAGQRKIVLATTIAETSLTIEGIRVVVDSGLRRYAEFDPATGMSRLVTAKVVAGGRGSKARPRRTYKCWLVLPALVRRHASLPFSANRTRNRARGSRPARARTQLLGGRRCGQPALARSAARRPTGPGPRPPDAAGCHRRRRPDYPTRPLTRTRWRASPARSYAGQIPVDGRAPSRLRSRRHLERAGYPTSRARHSRRRPAPADRCAAR